MRRFSPGWLVFLVGMLVLVGCSGLFGSEGEATGLPTMTTSKITPTPALVQTVAPESSATLGGVTTLEIWLPPQFDPKADTPAGRLLQQQLSAYDEQHADVQLVVRIKALDGAGGMLDSLTTASAAAPQALPDLVALPRPLLEIAALKGLLHPYDGLTDILNAPDWYNYARQLARLQNSTYGLPFAGDGLLLVSQKSGAELPPSNWGQTLLISGTLSFAAADPQGLVSLAFYQSAGGILQDDQGRPTLDSAVLTQVLSFYQQAVDAGRMTPRLAQYETDSEVWEAFLAGQTQYAITWAERYFHVAEINDSIEGTLLPTYDGRSFTLARGWVWALSSPDPQTQQLSTELAHFLVEADFLAAWTEAAGYLPPRAAALDLWKRMEWRLLAEDLVISATLLPSVDMLPSLGSALKQATLLVLLQEEEPLFAAQAAAGRLQSP